MTLLIATGTQEGVWLSADHRLTAFPTGKLISDASVKQNLLICPDGTLVIGYAGLGRDKDGSDLSDWLRSCLRGLNLRVDDALEVVKERATDELGRFVRFPHVFLAGAFINGVPALYQITNVLDRPMRRLLPPHIVERFLKLPRHVFVKIHLPVGSSGTLVAGSGAMAIRKNERDHQLLRRLAAMRGKDPNDYAGLLARLNSSAAKKVRTVSSGCVVTYIAPNGSHRLFRYSSGYSKPDETLQVPVNVFGIDIVEAMKHLDAGMGNSLEQRAKFLEGDNLIRRLNESLIVGQTPRRKP
jgi:hypothetical protein